MATQASDLTLSDKPSEIVVSSNRSILGSTVMVRTRRRREWPPVSGGFGRFQEPMKRVAKMDPLRPYQDPTQVPLGEKP